jgi:hypothetical protein
MGNGSPNIVFTVELKMDVILLIILLEIAIVYYFFHLIWITSILFLLYLVFKYFDGDEYTGNRSWGVLRRFISIPMAIKWTIGDKKSLEGMQRLLYIVVRHNHTHMGLLYGFGLHGGHFNNDTCFVLPHHLFYIPFVRDILLWCGAISDTTDIVQLLHRGKSLCTTDSTPDLFNYVFEQKIKVVPVYIENEDLRYHILRLPSIQRWTSERLKGWPFPFFFCLRWKPAKLAISVGCPMSPHLYNSSDKYREAFLNQIE